MIVGTVIPIGLVAVIDKSAQAQLDKLLIERNGVHLLAALGTVTGSPCV